MENSRKEDLIRVLNIVSEETKIPLTDLISKNRKRPIADARKIFCRVLHNNILFDYTVVEIGNIINRNHSTVSIASQQADLIKFQDRTFRQALSRVNERLERIIDVNIFNHMPQL